MLAYVLTEPGPAEALKLSEIPIPQISGSDVLIEVKAISINPVDVKTRNGKARYNALKDKKPLVLGWDVSGLVVQTGPDATFSVGDEVFGMVNFPETGSAYAEYVAAPSEHLSLKPANISHTEAAAACLAALTAWQAFTEHGNLQAGQAVLIHAGAGGVGHFAIQLAKSLGAYVIATSSAENREFVLSLGADEHIDYHALKFEDTVKNMDLVFDAVGGETAFRSFPVLKKDGLLISIPSGTTPGLAEAAEKAGVRNKAMMVHTSAADMAETAKRLEDGRLKVTLGAVFGFKDLHSAHRQVESGHTRGKTVVVTGE